MVEFLFVLALIAVITGILMFTIFSSGADKEAKLGAVRDSVNNIYHGCTLWRRGEGSLDWSTITQAKLTAGGFVKAIAFEAGSNPFGGTYEVTYDAADNTILIIRVTGVPDDYLVTDFSDIFKRSAMPNGVTLSSGVCTIRYKN